MSVGSVESNLTAHALHANSLVTIALCVRTASDSLSPIIEAEHRAQSSGNAATLSTWYVSPNIGFGAMARAECGPLGLALPPHLDPARFVQRALSDVQTKYNSCSARAG